MNYPLCIIYIISVYAPGMTHFPDQNIFKRDWATEVSVVILVILFCGSNAEQMLYL